MHTFVVHVPLDTTAMHGMYPHSSNAGVPPPNTQQPLSLESLRAAVPSAALQQPHPVRVAPVDIVSSSHRGPTTAIQIQPPQGWSPSEWAVWSADCGRSVHEDIRHPVLLGMDNVRCSLTSLVIHGT